MNQVPLAQLVNEMEELNVIASRDPINYGATAPSIAVAARQARDRIAELKLMYGRQLREGVVPICVDSEQFATIAAEEFSAIPLDVSKMYAHLARSIEGSIGPSREFNTNQVAQLISGIRELAIDLDFMAINAPNHDQLPVVCPDEASVAAYIKKAMRAGCGDEVNLRFLSNELTTLALEEGVKNSAIAVVLYNLSEGEVESISTLFSRTPEVLTIDGPVTKEVVGKQLVAIKNKLKTQTQPKTK